MLFVCTGSTWTQRDIMDDWKLNVRPIVRLMKEHRTFVLWIISLQYHDMIIIDYRKIKHWTRFSVICIGID